jgi:anti-sigma regulatory factor (Ser/Thr protein kinase)
MILSELFCNALDHGLLELDSSIKSTPIGFMDFYEQKSARLENLNQGYIKASLINKKAKTGSLLTIIFEDSGQGFDTRKLDQAKDMKTNEGYSGRGYRLIKNFSEFVKYNDIGNKIECVFHIE